MAKKDRGGIPTPDVIDPPESMQMTLCIPKNKDHMMAFFGALWELTMWDSWQPDAAHTGKDLAAVWMRYWMSWERQMNDILCTEGDMNCCTEPAITRRVNPTTGKLEQSANGGTTWSPMAGGWESVITEPVPPVTSGVAANKCDAATNVAGQVDVWIDQVSNDFTTATSLVEFAAAVLEAIAIAVVAVLTGGTLTALQLGLLAALNAGLGAAWAAGKTVFDAYWTTDIKDAILCAAFCNIQTDGSFTDAGFSNFWGQVNTDLPASPAKMLFMGFLSSVGKAGLNSMAATGMAADSDCADCDCGDLRVFSWDELADHVTEVFPDDEGVYIAHSGTTASSGHYICSLVFTNELPVPAHWKCAPITVINNPTEFGVVQYRCSDYTPDPLSTCNAEYTFHSDVAPFDITFTVGEQCGAH